MRYLNRATFVYLRATLAPFIISLTPLTGDNPYATIGAIPVPAGFHRVVAAPGSFAAWLPGPCTGSSNGPLLSTASRPATC